MEVHGNFTLALIVGTVLSALGWVVELGAVAIKAIFTNGNSPFTPLILVIAGVYAFWFMPVVVLRYGADFMPATVNFYGWMPAISAGLLLFVVGLATSGAAYKKLKQTDQVVATV